MDPLTPQVTPAPVSPPGVPGIPSAPAQEGLSQEQMKANLREMQTTLANKYQGFNKQNRINEINSKEQASELLRTLFDMLESQGVDPNSPEAVKAFLDKIKESDPERYQQIVQALNMILSGDEVAPEAVPGEALSASGAPAAPVAPLAPEGLPSDNMNINPNAQTSPNI